MMGTNSNPPVQSQDAYESAWIEAKAMGITRTGMHDLIARYFFEIGAYSALSTVKQSMEDMETK